MFELRPESIKTFINDKTIRLPRFQRKQTWGPKKNFKLCLSLFKGYPLGMVVIKREGLPGSGSGLQKFLLDGRQRRNALVLATNPEEIYDWARESLKLRANDTADAIREKFEEFINDYFGEEEWQTSSDSSDGDDAPATEPPDLTEAVDEATDTIDNEVPSGSIAQQEIVRETEQLAVDEQVLGSNQIEGLSELLEMILVVHPKRKRSSGMTWAFDFDRHFEDLEYVIAEPITGKRVVDALRLLAWLESQRRLAEIQGIDFPPSESAFVELLLSRMRLRGREERLRTAVSARWPKISRVIELLDSLDKRLQESQLGYLEIKECTPNDEKKIFEIINTEGTPLTAAEILSAKPWWNKIVEEPNEALAAAATRLYSTMAIPSEDGLVRWDVPATLLDRLRTPLVLGDLSDAPAPKNFERKVTLGFQLYSGQYKGRIAKNDIAELGKRDDIPWGSQQLETVMNEAMKLVSTHEPFKFWISWGLSIADSMSDAVALNFLLLLTRDWERKGRPQVAGSKLSAYRKNALTLLDRSIWEYVTGRWRGSSDSRLANNLAELERSGEIFSPIPNESWAALVEEVIEDGTIDGSEYAAKLDQRIKILLCYANTLEHFMNPSAGQTIHVDHIIPKALFEVTANAQLKAKMHHICNLQLLPDDVNREKSAKRLRDVDGDWAKQMIARCSGIPEGNFRDFNNPEDLVALKAFRGEQLRDSLTTTRVARLIEG